MSQKTIPLADASAAELRAFADQYLGVKLQGRATESMRAQIATMWDKPDIMINEGDLPELAEVAMAPGAAPVAEAPVDDERARRANETSGRNDKKRCIMIPQSESAGGELPVKVGVNGTAMLIPRGKRVVVPERYVKALENAVERRFFPVRNEATGQTVGMEGRDVMRYPFMEYPLPAGGGEAEMARARA